MATRVTISTSEHQFIRQGVDQDIRGDGRGRMDYRHFTLETGIISQTNGSARIRLSNTDVLVGIKAEIGQPKLENPDRGYLQFYAECCPSASPEFEDRGLESLNVELARFLERIICGTNSFDLKPLCIVPGKQCWILYVDVMILDSGGNLFDIISLATLAALSNVKIPEVKVVQGEGDTEIELTDDPEAYTKLDVTTVPICVSLTRIGAHFVVDSTLVEEMCMAARLSIAVNKTGRVCAIQKGGVGGFDSSVLPHMIKTAGKIAKTMINQLETVLER